MTTSAVTTKGWLIHRNHGIIGRNIVCTQANVSTPGTSGLTGWVVAPDAVGKAETISTTPTATGMSTTNARRNCGRVATTTPNAVANTPSNIQKPTLIDPSPFRQPSVARNAVAVFHQSAGDAKPGTERA